MIKIKRDNPLVVAVVVVGLLLFFHGLGWLRPLEDALTSVVKPWAGALYDWGGAGKQAAAGTPGPAALTAAVASLRQQVAALTVAAAQTAEVADENTKLRALLSFSSSHSGRTVAASVIARDETAADGRGLIIDRGARDGLRAGLAVVSEAGVIVGQVTAVKDATAQICLTTSPDCQLAAALQNQAKTQGLTDGDLGLTVKMSYIPQLDQIKVGDTVITSGLGGDIPRGLVIGRVASVESQSNAVWQTATIEPLADLNRLTVVAVIIP